MGVGDEIMAAGQVKALRARNPARVRILDRHGRPRWHDIWEGNPGICRPHERCSHVQLLRNGPGLRPYIDRARSTPARWAWSAWKAEPGEIFGVSRDARGEGYVLIEPEIKPGASPNKQWGRWTELVRMPGKWAQMCPPGVPALPGVHRIETRTFREACGVLLAARGAVLPEGGLHHAAAALGLSRIVVLFGAYISPRQTGYDMHCNLAVDDPEAAGWRIPHAACKRAWAQITPELVMSHLEKRV